MGRSVATRSRDRAGGLYDLFDTGSPGTYVGVVAYDQDDSGFDASASGGPASGSRVASGSVRPPRPSTGPGTTIRRRAAWCRGCSVRCESGSTDATRAHAVAQEKTSQVKLDDGSSVSSRLVIREQLTEGGTLLQLLAGAPVELADRCGIVAVADSFAPTGREFTVAPSS